MSETSLDQCFDLLADGTRRNVIRLLRHETEGVTTVDELVDHVHGSEAITVSRGRPDRGRLAAQLVHVHLPKMAEYGVIEYDPEEETVEYRPDYVVESVLDSLPHDVMPPVP